jgi:myo-inositol-1(or 4)-monophosphatase
MSLIRTVIYEAFKHGGEIIRTNIKKKKRVHHKSPIDLLTTTDKKVENTIIKLIRKNFPAHAILAEESGLSGDKKTIAHDRHASYKWIIDPIDGTTNFYHSFPHASISIAVEKDGDIIAGGVYDPLKDELFYAEKGKGARLNGKKIFVSSTPKLSDALLVTGFPYDRREKADYYLSFLKEFMMQTHGIRRLGSAALDYCYVACGRFDGYWEFKLKPWDVAAGSLILTEAGGSLSDFKGKPFSIYESETLASNGKIHAALVRTTKKLVL